MNRSMHEKCNLCAESRPVLRFAIRVIFVATRTKTCKKSRFFASSSQRHRVTVLLHFSCIDQFVVPSILNYLMRSKILVKSYVLKYPPSFELTHTHQPYHENFFQGTLPPPVLLPPSTTTHCPCPVIVLTAVALLTATILPSAITLRSAIALRSAIEHRSAAAPLTAATPHRRHSRHHLRAL